MPLVKKYLTWLSKQVNSGLIQHPCTNNRASEDSNGDINFIETKYEALDGRQIGMAEHEGNLPQTRIDALMNIDPVFEFKSVTESDINELLLETYGTAPPGQSGQMVSVSNYIFTDLRPDDV